MVTPRIVVGTNGSAGSVAAVRWAATEARMRDAELRLVVAYHRPPPLGQPEPAGVLRDAVTTARQIAPGIEVHGAVLPGYAVPVLLHAAEKADLLVVGDHGPGVLFLDGVGGQVATQAHCSVVVVRGRAGGVTGPVVVGVDDDPASDSVIGRAFEEAALHGAAVRVVTAGPDRTGPSGRLEVWRERYGTVAADHEYIDGRPDKVLVESCREARLAVVGPRRRYEGVLLGSIGSRLLRRADCPVLIAR